MICIQSVVSNHICIRSFCYTLIFCCWSIWYTNSTWNRKYGIGLTFGAIRIIWYTKFAMHTSSPLKIWLIYWFTFSSLGHLDRISKKKKRISNQNFPKRCFFVEIFWFSKINKKYIRCCITYVVFRFYNSIRTVNLNTTENLPKNAIHIVSTKKRWITFVVWASHTFTSINSSSP